MSDDYGNTLPIEKPKPDVPARFQWRHHYDPIRDALERANTDIQFTEPSKTIQSFTQDVDINVMMKRFGVTDGALPPAALDPKYFGDFSDVPDFRSALEHTRDAQARFDALPASLRQRFGNDPLTLWQFVNNADNHDEAVKLGLLKRATSPQPAVPQTPTGPTSEPVT